MTAARKTAAPDLFGESPRPRAEPLRHGPAAATTATEAPSPYEHPTTAPLPPLIFLTPLAPWSELSQATCELHLAVGYALAVAMSSGAPTPEQKGAIESALRRVQEHFAACVARTTAHAAEEPKADVGDFAGTP